MNNRNEEQFFMPEWMKTEETRPHITGRDTFIDKSILSLLNILSKIEMQDTVEPPKRKVNALLKVVFSMVLIIAVSISESFAFVSVVNVYLLLTLSAMKTNQIVSILRISLTMVLFTIIVLLPAAFWGNSYSLIMITSKVFATITTVNILSHSTQWNELTKSLKKLFVPDIFILVFDITIKYIYLFGEMALHMLYALKLRSVGINKSKYTSLAGIGGTIFMKSKEMAEEMYQAMRCRGFTGEYAVAAKYKMSAADVVYIIMNAALGVIFLYVYRI